MIYKPYLSFFLFPLFFILKIEAQPLEAIGYRTTSGLEIDTVRLAGGEKIALTKPLALFSLEVNGTRMFSTAAKVKVKDGLIRYAFANGLIGTFQTFTNSQHDWQGVLQLENHSTDTLIVENVVPFGAIDDHIYLTAAGPPGLTRTYLFRPGKVPVNVILPDNAWEMGYASVDLKQGLSMTAFCRRTGNHGARLRRFFSTLPPDASLEYTFYAGVFKGEWQNGLKLMFRDRYLEDLDKFDNTLYEREDLKWIRDKYLIALQMAWDKEFFDLKQGKYNYQNFLGEAKKLLGGYGVYGLWPGWPRLGLDERNQWQLYQDLPGGLAKIKELAALGRKSNTRFFISYNPWDKSTNLTDHRASMAKLIQAVDADGVVLDTRGSSSKQLQRAADSVRQGVVMYSEGMAVIKDMPGIVSGRVHNAIERSPILNLNKLVKPEFAIFRVNVLHRGPFNRDVSISFFNGYGTEINFFNAGRPDWMEETLTYLGRTTKILRENAAVFQDTDWTPLITTLEDNIWVNKWKSDRKTLYTVLSIKTEGYLGPLFRVDPTKEYHFVSLWHHRELDPLSKDGAYYIPIEVKEYNKSLTGTNMEGSIDCIARLPRELDYTQHSDSLEIKSQSEGQIYLWSGNPSYQLRPAVFNKSKIKLRLSDYFDKTTGKFVVQLMHENRLVDEIIIEIEPGKPQLISQVQPTAKAKKPPRDMVEVKGGTFLFKVTNPDQFVPYPDFTQPREIYVKRFFMDKYPVTNQQFSEFLKATSYTPEDTTNFLKHWLKGTYPEGEGGYPVVYVDLADARAYAKWQGKRLPTEIEWQYAAQGEDGRVWPWGDKFDASKCNNAEGNPTAVDQYPEGESPFNVADMVGNIWQLTNDVYDDGSYRFVIIRGGSYYNPTSSNWYVKGGPQPLDKTQMLLLVSPGFDRSSTVGFRCVMEAK
jgi:formylglycine-generating enzyme required for sulfatase activity